MWGLKTMKKGVALASVLALGACATSLDEVQYKSRPQAAPVQNISSFSTSLACMDKLFLAYGIRDIRITTKGIPDATREIYTGTREMLISAFSAMSVRSKAFTYVDREIWREDYPYNPELSLVPNYYIRGAITQLDESVVSESVGGGVGFEANRVGASADQVISLVSVDLNVGETLSRQILPGVTARNSIAVRKRGVAGDARGVIEKASLSFNVSFNRSEGMHQAIRTLMDLSAIEVAGKMTRTPYWQCLGLDQTNMEIEREMRNWFDRMGDEERVLFVQNALGSLGYYSGPRDGAASPRLTNAIGAYQNAKGLSAMGRIDQALYASLLSEDLRTVSGVPRRKSVPANYSPDAAASKLSILLTDTEEKTVYEVGSKPVIQARLNGTGYLYCYYQDASGGIAQIFPNRFQPSAAVGGGRLVSIPPNRESFEIVLGLPNALETVQCHASRKDLGPVLPQMLQVRDLEPMETRSLQDITRAITATGADVTTARLEFLTR